MQRLINAGYGNCVNTDKVIAVVGIDAAPIKRAVQNAKDAGRIIDMTQGRKTKCAIIMEDGYIALSAMSQDTIVARYNSDTGINCLRSEEDE